MKTICALIAAAALATVLSACGDAADTGTAAPPAGSSAPAAGTSAPAAGQDGSGSPADDRAEVETAFRDYYRALLERDFASACARNAPETTAKLLDDLATRGVTARTCEEAFGELYAMPGVADAADGIARSIEVQDASVTGDDASITWSAELQGERRTVTAAVRRVDDRWLLIDTE